MELGSKERVILCAIALSLLNQTVVRSLQFDYHDEDNSYEDNMELSETDDIQVVTYKMPSGFLKNEAETRRVDELDGGDSFPRDYINNSPEQPNRNRSRDGKTFGLDEDDFVERKSNAKKCGINSMSNKKGMGDYIAGGYTASYGDFPSYVRLDIKKDDGYSSACGGTLITRQHVLTAAHCTKDAIQILVRPTVYLVPSDTEQTYEATTICVNEIAHNVSSILKRVFYDASILKLDRPVTLNERVQLACLPDKALPSKARAIAVGLGIIDNRDSATVEEPEQLQALPVKRITCRADDRHKSNVCFQSYMPQYKGDTCVGDSGGPLLMQSHGRQVIVGITSYGPLECHPGTRGYSVNADVYFLREVIKAGLDSCK